MKKIIIIAALFIMTWNVFCLETQMDTIVGGFVDFSGVTGKTTYDKMDSDYVIRAHDCDYAAKYKAGGGFIGFDLFFNDFPIGVYMREGFLGVSEVERTVRNTTKTLENTEFTFNTYTSIGAVYEYDINNYFSVCGAPAFSMLWISSENAKFAGLASHATIDSLWGLGLSGDVYAKFRYKYFTATAGFNGAFYPLAFVESADSEVQYSRVFKDTHGYSLRPYIAIGFTFKEKTGTVISPSN